MSLRRPCLAVLLVALILAGCNLGVPENPVTTDWCYTFDFTADSYDFSLPYGEWVEGTGLVTDEQARLSAGYSNPLSVQAVYIILTVGTLEGFNPTTVNFTISGNIFGFNTNGPLAASVDVNEGSTEVFLQPDPNDFSSSINFSIQSSARFAVSSLEVRGNGVNPFPSNGCNPTPTPSASPFLATDAPTRTATPSPTLTLTPSETPIASATLTPSSTPVPNWCYEFVDPFDDTYPGFMTEYNAGSGGDPGTWFQVTYIELGDTSTILTHAEMDYEFTGFGVAGAGEDIEWESGFDYGVLAGESPPPDLTGTQLWTGSQYPTRRVRLGAAAGNSEANATGYTVTITRARIEGTGAFDNQSVMASYACAEPTDTPTPTTTHTPTNTGTPPTHTITPAGTRFGTQPVRSSTPVVTAVPSRATNTRVPIYTLPPLATLPPPQTAQATVTAHPSYTPNGTITAQFLGTMTATYGGTGTPGATGTPYNIPWPTSVPGDTGEGGDSGQGGIAAYGNGLLGFAENAMQQGIAWLGELRIRASLIFTSYQNAAPQPLPSLPHCATDRLASELCAIYYILTNTLFSGVVGSIIIPVAVIDIDIVIVFTFIKLARAIIARLAEVLKQ